VITSETPLSVHAPATDSKGGLVVIQEAFGVNEHIEDVARRFASAGFLAVAPHLFHRRGDPKLAYDDLPPVMAEMGALTGDMIRDDVDAALNYLSDNGFGPASIGVVGFCMGGAITLATAARRDIGAAVTFYGSGIKTSRFGFRPLLEEAADLRCPWLGLFGDLDPSIPVADVEELRTAATSSGQITEVVRYPEAGHGFHCDRRSDYRADSAADAWTRTLEWFDRYLHV
jgi:carboxymethylenebutenolidase